MKDRKFYLQSVLRLHFDCNATYLISEQKTWFSNYEVLSELLLATGERGDKRLKDDNCQESSGIVPNA